MKCEKTSLIAVGEMIFTLASLDLGKNHNHDILPTQNSDNKKQKHGPDFDKRISVSSYVYVCRSG